MTLLTNINRQLQAVKTQFNHAKGLDYYEQAKRQEMALKSLKRAVDRAYESAQMNVSLLNN